MSDDPKCVAGCVPFYGGEKRHHKDCPYYPESLTKLNADRIEELEAKLNLAQRQVVAAEFNLATCKKYRDTYAECDRIGTQAVRELEAKLAKYEAVTEAQKLFNHYAVEIMLHGATASRLQDLECAWTNLEVQSELAELKGKDDE